MKVGYALIVYTMVAVSCTEVSFPVHQPRGIAALSNFPIELQGRYITSQTDSLRDTLFITQHAYRFSSALPEEQSWLAQGQLSDSLILKEYKGLYFVNFREDNQWLLRVLKRERTGDLQLLTLALDGPGKDKLLWQLQQELTVETIVRDSSEKYYQIDPTPKRLLKLLKKEKYWKESTLIRVK
jgi:hypothetical protein